MDIRESIRLAASSLNNNKLRSLLTLLGIIIGIMAVIIIMTLGAGLQNQVMSSIEGVGATNHVVMVHERPKDGAETIPGMGEPPTEEQDQVSFDQIAQMREHFGPRIQGVDVENSVSNTGEITAGEAKETATISAALADTLAMRNKNVQFGRGFSGEDISQGRPVTVVSSAVVESMFGGDAQGALGERIDVTVGSNTAVFTVVGVLENEGNSGMFGASPAAEMFIPLEASDRVGEKVDALDSFSVQSRPGEDTTAFQSELQNYVNRWYEHNEDYEITVIDLSKGLEELTNVFGIISKVLSSIGGISLVVGGIGVMNIMLITVTERTREIGIRKALGATQADIRTQFIVEAILVCLIGGVIGIVLGSAIGMAATAAFDAFVAPPLGAVLMSLVFSLATGVFFGAYPASKAAKMQPIDALRYE
ncbi:ABC transporter permease [Corynebacterium liangguodongii]|uniref:ABC transporter permease n=1 Tax=Corynebacterium liangguodongii TaxID=2079535 RepID=A0A2S0WEX7_9CORY|nr:ABC transporter permease [Corynebacterium liangguodongii]AWB84335.1 ABC transporter permease [Corynebacterium liangguodongii]PWB99825.1 ABC transporter permease [Corynebacterium liangguodongii]